MDPIHTTLTDHAAELIEDISGELDYQREVINGEYGQMDEDIIERAKARVVVLEAKLAELTDDGMDLLKIELENPTQEEPTQEEIEKVARRIRHDALVNEQHVPSWEGALRQARHQLGDSGPVRVETCEHPDGCGCIQVVGSRYCYWHHEQIAGRDVLPSQRVDANA